MARQSGHVAYEGTIGKVRHFKIKGQEGFFAGLKGGVSAERIKNGAEYKRTRENNNEFGGCAKFSRSIRYTFPGLIRGLGDSKAGSRLLRTAKRINLGDVKSMRGYRAFELSKNRDLLKNMELNIDNPLETVFRIKFEIENLSRTEAVLTVAEPFCAIDQLMVPKGASHFRFVLAMGIVSDYAFNTQAEAYTPVNEALNGVSKVSYSPYISTKSIVAPFTLECAMAQTNLPDNVSVLQLVGIEFYQAIEDVYYTLDVGNALKITSAN